MADTVPDVLFTLTATGEVTYISHRMKEYTGQPLEALIGTAMWPALVHPDDLAQTETRWQWALAHEKSYEVRHRLRMEEGTYSWFITRAQPIHDEEGMLVQWFGTLNEVDKLVRTEQALQALNQSLEDHVAERTAQVQNLMKSLTLAEHEERGRVAEILHDDLQQILYGLGMTLELLRNPSSEEEERELREQVDVILTQAEDLTRSLSTDLSPPVLRSENLEDLLHWLAIDKEEKHGLTLDVEMRGELRIKDHAIRVLRYTSLRELLFNIVNHAGVDPAQIVAWQAGDAHMLRWEDGGNGLDRGSQEAGLGGGG
jgi:PAS domain S-box-containing protein